MLPTVSIFIQNDNTFWFTILYLGTLQHASEDCSDFTENQLYTEEGCVHMVFHQTILKQDLKNERKSHFFVFWPLYLKCGTLACLKTFFQEPLLCAGLFQLGKSDWWNNFHCVILPMQTWSSFSPKSANSRIKSSPRWDILFIGPSQSSRLI